MTPRYNDALALAARAHLGQSRKGTAIPYIVHPVGVAGLVALYGGDEDQQIAALLHDVLEDGGPEYAAEIASHFGERVLRIVQGCTDALPDALGKKPDWKTRKQAYLAYLADTDADTLLVSCCDKLYNAQAIRDDVKDLGDALYERFGAGKAGTHWYYQSLAQAFCSAAEKQGAESRLLPAAKALAEVVAGLEPAYLL